MVRDWDPFRARRTENIWTWSRDVCSSWMMSNINYDFLKGARSKPALKYLALLRGAAHHGAWPDYADEVATFYLLRNSIVTSFL